MAQAMLNVYMDEDLIENMEQTCHDMGFSLSTVFTAFADRVTKEKRIPFDVSIKPDPFYSEANMAELNRRIAKAEAGEATFIVKTLEELEAMANE